MPFIFVLSKRDTATNMTMTSIADANKDSINTYKNINEQTG